jgi:phenylacetate-CoA ligase
VILIGYPTALTLLADEQEAGRLAISPAVAVTSAEWLSPAARDRIRTAFRCSVHDVSAASEFLGIAYECAYGWLHVNADWLLLEPVDQDWQPVAPGQPSRTGLLTNLANRVQPIIRYDLGDSVMLCPHSCPCDGPLPTTRVEGRRDDILYLASPVGRKIPVLPRAVATVLEGTQGVRRFQVIQTGPAALQVRLEASPGLDDASVWDAVVRALSDYLPQQEWPSIQIERDPERPRRDPVSGKFRQVWTERTASAPVS